jgi:microcystin-dependent protein
MKFARLIQTLASACLLLAGLHSPLANAQAQPFLGQMIWVPYNFAPRGWAFCNGQLMNLAQNTALFSLLGTTYGGNGSTNFALPNMQGRLTVGPGQAPGLSIYEQGQSGGAEIPPLTEAEMPAHPRWWQPPTRGGQTSRRQYLYARPAAGPALSPTGGSSIAATALACWRRWAAQQHDAHLTLNCIIAAPSFRHALEGSK